MKRFNFGKKENGCGQEKGKCENGLVPFEGGHFFDSIFENFFNKPFDLGFGLLETAKRPALDIYEKDNKIVVKADLPGVDKKEIKLHLEDGILTISGEKKTEKEVKKDNYYHVERSYGSIQRSIRVPYGTKESDIKASYKDGVLSVELPKPDKGIEKGRSIEIE